MSLLLDDLHFPELEVPAVLFCFRERRPKYYSSLSGIPWCWEHTHSKLERFLYFMLWFVLENVSTQVGLNVTKRLEGGSYFYVYRYGKTIASPSQSITR